VLSSLGRDVEQIHKYGTEIDKRLRVDCVIHSSAFLCRDNPSKLESYGVVPRLPFIPGNRGLYLQPIR
jgi:hypothetical protein